MSHFQFESCIEDCLDKFSAPLRRVATPRWQRKRNNSTTSLPLSPFNPNRSLRTPCKTPKIKTPLKTPKSKRTPRIKSPGKATPHVDRFIPNRTTMDNDKNYFQIVNNVETGKKDNELSPDTLEKVHYEKTVKENLEESCDSRILHFKQRAPLAPEGFQNSLRVLYSQNQGSSKTKSASSRYISKVPEKILDAPDLRNDFYLNLIDWGSNNCIGIGLGSDVYFWNHDTFETRRLLQLQNHTYVSSVSWMNQSNVLAVGSSDGNIILYDVEKSEYLRTMSGHCEKVGSLAWNSFILSSGARNGWIVNQDVRVQNPVVSVLREHVQDVCGLEWSPDGRTLASGGNDNLLQIWSPLVAGQLPIHTFTHHQAAVKAVAWCPWQSNLLASGGGTADRHIRLWNTTTGSCVTSFDTKSQVSGILWSKDYKELISGHGFSMNQLTIWKYPSMNKVANLENHCGRVLCMTMSPSGEHVASAGADETLRIWKCFDQSELKKKSAAGGRVMKTSKTSLNMTTRIR